MEYIVDGSFKGIVLGAGVVVKNKNGTLQEYSFATVDTSGCSQQAELFAIETAIGLMLKSKKQQRDTNIYTDNL